MSATPECSKMEKANYKVICTFKKYANNQEKMAKGQFLKLMKEQYREFSETIEQDCKLSEMMKVFDENDDGQISFEEYMVFVGLLSIICDPTGKSEGCCSDMEGACYAFLETFEKYAEKKGDINKMSKNKFKEMVNAEYKYLLGQQHDAAGLDKLMEAIDMDGDGELDFPEFITLVMSVIQIFNETRRPGF